MKTLTKAYWALGAVYFFWGTTYIAIKYGVREVPPCLFSSVRFLMAGTALLAYALYRGYALPRGRQWPPLIVTAFFLLTVGNGTLAWAEQWVPAGIASLIIASIPFWMVAFAAASGEPVTLRGLAGLGVGVLGIGVLLWPDMRGGALKSGYLPAAGALCLSSASWAFGSIYLKRKPPATEPLMTIALQTLAASVFLFVLAVIRDEPASWHPNASAWWAIVYLAIFGSIVGYTAYVYALRHLPTEIVATYAIVNPVVAVLMAVPLFNERFDRFMLVGSPLVLLGVYLVNAANKPRAAAPEPAA